MGFAREFVGAFRTIEGAVGVRLAYGIVVMPMGLGSFPVFGRGAVTFRGEFVLSGSFPVELMHDSLREHDGGQMLFGLVPDVLTMSFI